MEDMFDLLIGLAAIVIGVIAKINSSNKKKKSAKPPVIGRQAEKPAFDWEELEKKLVNVIADEDEPEDDEAEQLGMDIPYAPPAPAPVHTPAVAPAPVIAFSAAADAESGSMLDPAHPEGCHAEEGALKTHVQPAKKPEPVNSAAGSAMSAPVFNRKRASLTAAQLRQAVVMNEVLGKPVSLRPRAR